MHQPVYHFPTTPTARDESEFVREMNAQQLQYATQPAAVGQTQVSYTPEASQLLAIGKSIDVLRQCKLESQER